jgi:hypothetical protein
MKELKDLERCELYSKLCIKIIYDDKKIASSSDHLIRFELFSSLFDLFFAPSLSAVEFHVFIILTSIDFQFDVNLLDFYAEIKGGYMRFGDTKTIASNFH